MKNIAIITGGDSSEKIISVQSAAVVKANMDNNTYQSFVIDIQGSAWTYDDNGTTKNVDKNDFSIDYNGSKITFDGVFFAIHGTPGEDGKLQGYFDVMNIPYSTCSVLSSSLCFNKFASKEYLKAYDIPTAKAVQLAADHNMPEKDILDHVGLPCFVKPNSGGSSFGASKVNTAAELGPALAKSFNEASQTIVEEFIAGTEITCGAYQIGKEVTALPITEIVTENEFFDFEAKYEGKSNEITPARISDELTAQCYQLTKEIYQLLDCKGIVRVDYLIRDEKLYFMEVNTIPGMSAASLIPQQVEYTGMKLTDFFTQIVRETIG